MTKLDLLHVGINAKGFPYNGMQQGFSDVFNYHEINKKVPDVNNKILEYCAKAKPHILFMQIQEENVILPETVQKVRKMGTTVFNWTGDVRDPIPEWFYPIGKHCVTLFSNMHDVKKMRESDGWPADFLQIGYDDKIFNPAGASYDDYDIVFLGNNYTNAFPLSEYRRNCVMALKEEFGSRFGIFGSGWGHHSEGQCNNYFEFEAALYRGSKIGINLSHFDYQQYFSDRMIRLIGTGCFCLTHNYKGIEKDWDPDRHVGVFEGPEDIVKKTRYWLDNDSKREKVATEGWRVAKNKFTYHQMAHNVEKLYRKWHL